MDESTLIVWEDLGSSPMYANFWCYGFVIQIYENMFLYIMISELWFLAWNMDWLNGWILIWQLHGCGFNPWRTYIKLYIFGIFGLTWIWKGEEET